MPKNFTKLKIQWIEDAYGKHSCHTNERGLNFKESYLGCVFFRGGDWNAEVYVRTSTGPDSYVQNFLVEKFKSIQAAKKFVEDKLDAETLNIWD